MVAGAAEGILWQQYRDGYTATDTIDQKGNHHHQTPQASETAAQSRQTQYLHVSTAKHKASKASNGQHNSQSSRHQASPHPHPHPIPTLTTLPKSCSIHLLTLLTPPHRRRIRSICISETHASLTNSTKPSTQLIRHDLDLAFLLALLSWYRSSSSDT